MVARNDPAAPTEKDTFKLTRVFDAPRELVWKAFTEPERLKQWWGPKGFTVKSAEVDLRVGGTFRYCLEAPGGAFTMCGRWVYQELEAPARMVDLFVHG